MTSFLILLVAYFLSQFFRAFLAVLAGDLTRDLGLGPAELGIVSSAWFTAFALAQFPVGYWLDHHGPRRTVAALLAVGGFGAGLFALADGQLMLVLAMALIGIGCSPILMGALYIFARTQDASRFAALASAFIGFGNVGNLAAATPLAWASALIGWRPAVMFIAALTLAIAALVFLLLRDPPLLERKSEAGDSLVGGLAAIVSLRALWPLLPITFISYAVVAAERALWIAPYLGEVHGFDTIERGNGALIMAAAMAIGGLLYAPVERLIGSPKRTVLIGSLGTAACFLTLGVWGATSAALSLALLAAIGCVGLTYGVLMAHSRLFYPPHLIGRGVTFINFAFIAGAGLLQPVSGAFIARAHDQGLGAAASYGWLHLCFGIALLVTTLIYLMTPERPETR